MECLPHVLTIAGSDSGGGAGIQADLKAITMLGGYGASVITALTAQNTTGVSAIHAPSAKFVARQMKAVVDDIRIDAAKTGMLFSAPIIKAIAFFLKKKKFPLVVDPVCVSTSGAKLLKDDAVTAMVEQIFPHADLLTPNIPEAELFTEMKIETQDDVAAAATKLLKMGPKAVLIKGGHLESVTSTDWFAHGDYKPIPLIQQRVDTKNTHGTGCTLSAAIATGLGQGMEMVPAIRRAQQYLNLALRAGIDVGEGGGPPNHLAPMLQEQARDGILDQLEEAARAIMTMPGFSAVVPEVRMNLAVAAPFADSEKNMAAFTGGIVSTRSGAVSIAGYPRFGASIQVAKALVAARRVCGHMGCMINLRQTELVLEALKKAELVVAWGDAENKPPYINNMKGAWEEWLVYETLKSHPTPEAVRVICDKGGPGREPLVRLMARDCHTLLERVRTLLRFTEDSSVC